MRSNHGRSEWIVHGAAVIWLSDDHGKEEEERVMQHGVCSFSFLWLGVRVQ